MKLLDWIAYFALLVSFGVMMLLYLGLGFVVVLQTLSRKKIHH